MGGMCLGSLLFSRVVSSRHSALKVYAMLEIATAVFVGGPGWVIPGVLKMLGGDFGESLRIREPVAPMLAQKLPVTLHLSIFAMAISLAIGIPAGIVSAIRPNSIVDYASRTISIASLSAPNFWLALLTILLLSNVLGAGKVATVYIPGIGPWPFGAGILFFPIGYVIGDIMTEVYGYAHARRVIWAGFCAMLFATLMSSVVIGLPPSTPDTF